MNPQAASAEGGGPFAPVWTDRRWLACAALLWLGCAALYFLTAPGRIDIIDGGTRYDVTASIIETGRPVVRSPFYPAVFGVDGRRYAFYQLGATVTALPFVWLGDRLGGGSLESRQFAFSLTSVPFAAAIVVLLFMIYGRLGCTVRRALAWSLVSGFCTLLWPYAGSTFDAVLQAFWLTLAVWAAIEAVSAHSIGWAGTSGAAFAMLINVQEMYTVLGVCLVAGWPITWRTIVGRLRLPAVQIALFGLSVGIMAVFAYDTFRFANPLVTGRASVPHPLVGNPVLGLAGLLVSPAKSIFLYSPPYALGLVGLGRLARRRPERFAPIVACLAVHILLISTLKFWAGEWAWGPRYLVASLPLACVGLPFALRDGSGRGLSLTVCGLGLVVQVLAIAVDHQRYYFERSFAPYFWVDGSVMYTGSPLLARPFELAAVLEGRDLEKVRALTPNPRPRSMTSSIFGPSPDVLAGKGGASASAWLRQYLVFLVPRPWPLWSRALPQDQRPGPTGLMTAVGAAGALAGFGGVGLVLQRRRNTKK